jgi:predicted SAM-dependent methyltransferase
MLETNRYYNFAQSRPKGRLDPYVYRLLRRRTSLLHRLLRPLLSRHLLTVVTHELDIQARMPDRTEVERTFAGTSGLRINLGCGPHGQRGWVNVDVAPRPGVNLVWDCRAGLPFPDSSAECIFTEHFVEHLDYLEDVPGFLAECLRVLRPSGTLRIVVPDAGAYVRACADHDWDALQRLRSMRDLKDPTYGCIYETPMELVNVLFRQFGEHLYAYDEETLVSLLRRYGFADAQRRAFGESGQPGLAIDRPERAAESLYIEAQRPADRR